MVLNGTFAISSLQLIPAWKLIPHCVCACECERERECEISPAMSLHTAPDCCDAPVLHLYRRSESGDDDDRRLKRREKNRVAAQRSRKRQTQRADELHECFQPGLWVLGAAKQFAEEGGSAATRGTEIPGRGSQTTRASVSCPKQQHTLNPKTHWWHSSLSSLIPKPDNSNSNLLASSCGCACHYLGTILLNASMFA